MGKKSKSSAKQSKIVKDSLFRPEVKGLDKCFAINEKDIESVPRNVKRQFEQCFKYSSVFGITDQPIGGDSVEYKRLVREHVTHLVVRLMLNNQSYTTRYCVLVNGDSASRGSTIPKEYHNYTFFASRGRANGATQNKKGNTALREFTFVPNAS